MSDDRCHAVHPTRGLPCTRSAKACNGIDHTARTPTGTASVNGPDRCAMDSAMEEIV